MYLVKRLLTLLLIGSGLPGLAQSPAEQPVAYDSLTLEDLMNIKVTVASIKEMTPRQSPGIITYITAEDIRALGARDLMEVLRHVPGFEFGMDVEGVVGLGVRGNWAHEGKVVLFIDGQEMNEDLFSTLQFGNHYPVDYIEQIEIIRGPGSALHGGFAAYAVINIITRQPQNGIESGASVWQSITGQAAARTGLNACLGTNTRNAAFSLKMSAAKAQRSHSDYTDIFGNGYDMQSQSDLENVFINAGGKIGNLSLRYIYDRYTVASRDKYSAILLRPQQLEFASHHSEIRYQLALHKKLIVIPSIHLSFETPWSTLRNNVETDMKPFRINTATYTGAVNASWDVTERTSVSFGSTLDEQVAQMRIPGDVFQTTNTANFTNRNVAAYAQVLHNAGWANLIAGIRYNYNVRFGNPVVPRIGLTRAFKNFHVKALYSKAFRAPAIQNIDLSDKIRPEFTDVYELESGFKISDDAYLTVNLFHLFTRDPIAYYVDAVTGTDAYTNLRSTGSTGLEMVFQLKKKWGSIDLNTSYYHPNDENDQGFYGIPGQNDLHLGLSRFKSNAMMRFNISGSWQAGTQLNCLGTRYGLTGTDMNTGAARYKKFDPQLLMNVYLEHRIKALKGLSVSVMVRNLFDRQEWFIQPFNSFHAPLPGMGREFQLRLSYQNF